MAVDKRDGGELRTSNHVSLYQVQLSLYREYTAAVDLTASQATDRRATRVARRRKAAREQYISFGHDLALMQACDLLGETMGLGPRGDVWMGGLCAWLRTSG